MEHSRKYSWSLRRTPDGPLAPYVDGFEGRLSALGYAETSAHLYTRLAADFSRWLKQKTVAKEEITSEHALRYLRYRARNQRPRTGDAAALTRLLDLLTEKGVIAPRRTPIDVTPAQRLLDEYALYLRQERVLASPTRVNYLRFVRRFEGKAPPNWGADNTVGCGQANILDPKRRFFWFYHSSRSRVMKGMIGLIVGCLAVNAFYIVPAIGQANRAAEPKSAVGGVFLLGAKRAADQQSPACPGDICPGLGNAFYLPSQNSMSINSGGAVFFADRKLGTCAVVSSASVGARDFKTADSMEHFIDNTMAEANISGSYTSAALSVKATAQAMTGSSTDIKTTFHSAYMDISLITSTVDFLQDSQCFTAKNLDGDFQKRFEALAPIDPKKAGDAAQWTPYVNFLQSVGSHIMMQQQVGSRFQQWESSDSTASDIATTLQVKACAEVEGTAGTGGWSVNSCGSYSNDQKNAALKTTTSTKRVILGSTDAARRDLLNEVSAANLTKFIDGANTGSGAVRFLFKPIWDLLYGIYQADCTAKGSPACANMQRALNLQAAYDGWTAIGCPQLGDYQFMATDSTDEYGISTWRCVAAKTGCRSDDVCHLGGAGSVCYCYGSGCIDQGDAIPSRSGSGTQTFRDKIRGSQQGSYSEGVNNACYYHFGAYCDCDTNWAGGLPDRNVYQQSVPSALQALRARR